VRESYTPLVNNDASMTRSMLHVLMLCLAGDVEIM